MLNLNFLFNELEKKKTKEEKHYIYSMHLISASGLRPLCQALFVQALLVEGKTFTIHTPLVITLGEKCLSATGSRITMDKRKAGVVGNRWEGKGAYSATS